MKKLQRHTLIFVRRFLVTSQRIRNTLIEELRLRTVCLLNENVVIKACRLPFVFNFHRTHHCRNFGRKPTTWWAFLFRQDISSLSIWTEVFYVADIFDLLAVKLIREIYFSIISMIVKILINLNFNYILNMIKFKVYIKLLSKI